MGDFIDLVNQYHLLAAFWMTVKLTVLSGIGALVLGTIITVMRVSPVKIFRWMGAVFIEIFRNVPLTLLMFASFFGLYLLLGWHVHPKADAMTTHAFDWAVFALAVHHAAFVAEALRSGINTVPLGQAEAARAIGLDFSQSLREVILPQAFRGAIAPLGNALIALIKNTTVVATIGVLDPAFQLKNMLEFSPQYAMASFFLVALGFVILCLPTGVLFTHLSQRLAVQR